MTITPPVAESAMNNAYWRQVEHPFVPARWGPGYCTLCSATREEREHLDASSLSMDNPMFLAGQTRPTRNVETWWKVEGWNENGGSCSYAGQRSLAAAQAQARGMQANGDHEGRRYEQYAVVEIVQTLVSTTYVHPVTAEAAEAADTSA